MKRKYLALIIIAVILCCSCASINKTTEEDFVSNTYKTLKTMAITYDAFMQTTAQLYKQDKISEQKKDKILEYGLIFYKSYHVASEALIAYKHTSDESERDKIIPAIKNASNFLNYIELYLGE